MKGKGMQDFVIKIMGQYGCIGIALLIAIENIFPPIPSEVILSFGGFMTTYSSFTLLDVIIASTIRKGFAFKSTRY